MAGTDVWVRDRYAGDTARLEGRFGGLTYTVAAVTRTSRDSRWRSSPRTSRTTAAVFRIGEKRCRFGGASVASSMALRAYSEPTPGHGMEVCRGILCAPRYRGGRVRRLRMADLARRGQAFASALS